MTIAIYPGSFDPVTNGHIDIIVRAGLVFEKIIVTVMDNPRKTPAFTLEERLEMLRETTKGMKNVEVDYYHGLLIDYVKQKKAKIIVKGLRAISDFEFEFQMALINRKLSEEVETMFMMTNNKYSYLSSSIIKEIASYGGDVRKLVPAPVLKNLAGKYAQKE